MDMPMSCDQCKEVKDFADFRDDPKGRAQMVCRDCYLINDADLFDWWGIPKCCLACNSYEETDWNEWTNQASHDCMLGVMLPTQKGECVRQN